MAPVNLPLHISPSGLHRDLNCTGAPFLSQGLPKQEATPWAEAGVKAHFFVLETVKLGDPEELMNLAGIDDCSFEEAQRYQGHAEALLALTANRVFGSELIVEFKLNQLQELGMVPSGREGEHQLDLAWVDPKRWNVLDYKSGNTPVEVKENVQLMAYAWALMKQQGLLGSEVTVRLWVYQPSLGDGVTFWDVTTARLRAFGVDVAKKIMEAEEGGKLVEGPWCQYCPVDKAKACPLKNQGRETRKETTDMAKTSAAAIGALLGAEERAEVQQETALYLPKVAADVVIPEQVTEAIDKLVEREESMLAVTTATAEEASALLKEIGLVEGKVEDAEMLSKRPYADAKKAVEDAFRSLRAKLATSKLATKKKIGAHLEIEERKRQAEIARQKAEQDRINKELQEKEAAAAKLKGAAAKKAEQEAQELRNKAAEASVVTEPAPVAKIGGVSVKKAWTFEVAELGKIPERYLIKSEGPLTLTGTKAVTIVEIDVALMTKDAAAGRFAKADWVKASYAPAVGSR